jgi:predicted transcriptional regulator
MSENNKPTSTTVSIAAPLAKQLRALATLKGIKPSAIVEEAIRREVAQQPEHVKLTLRDLGAI